MRLRAGERGCEIEMVMRLRGRALLSPSIVAMGLTDSTAPSPSRDGVDMDHDENMSFPASSRGDVHGVSSPLRSPLQCTVQKYNRI